MIAEKQHEQGSLGLGHGRFGVVKGGKDIVHVPEREVRLCKDVIDAARLAMRYSRVKRNDEDWAWLLRSRGLNLSPSSFNVIMNRGVGTGRTRNPPADMFERIGEESETDAIAQYYALRIGKKLTEDDRQRKIRELEQQLAELKEAS